MTDESGAAMPDVWVYVHDIPNHVGSTFSVGVPTNGSGVAKINAIPAGQRRVDVKPPAVYATPEAVAVDVVKSSSVTVRFRLTKNAAD